MFGSSGYCGQDIANYADRMVRNNNSASKKTTPSNNYNNANGSNTNIDNSNQLEKMSVPALESILNTFKGHLKSAKTEREQIVFQSRIDFVEKELKKRNGEIENIRTEKENQKISSIGSSVGTASLIFGIIGFMGSALMGSKRPFMWGFIGAGTGAAFTYFMSRDKNLKLIQPIQ